MSNRLLEEVYAQQRRAKAISHHPDLASRVHVSSTTTVDAFTNEVAADYISYARVYTAYVWVQKAIAKIAEAIAFLPVSVVKGETAEDSEEQARHELSELFLYVNDTTSPAHFWSTYIVHMLLGGEAFVELVEDGRGRLVEMWSRRPDHMIIIPDASRKHYPRVLEYVFDPTAGRDEKERILLPPDACFHDRFANPLSQFRGLAPITAIRSSIVIDVFAQAYSRTFLKRHARPDWALIAPEGLTPTERQDYEDALMDKFGGPENAHKPIVLERGITDIKILSFPPKDVEWLEQRKVSRDEVGGIFGVPDEVMGYGRDTYENMDAAHKWFWLLTLNPIIKRRDQALTSYFRKTRPMLADDEWIETNTSSIAALQEGIESKAEAAKTYWTMGVPANMINERLGLGFGEIPGGDAAFVPFSVIAVTDATTEGDEADDEQAAAMRAVTRSALVPDYGSPRHKVLLRAATMRWTPYERRMRADLLRNFEKQKRKTLDALDEIMGGSDERTVGLLAQGMLEAIAARQSSADYYPQEVDEFFDLDEWILFFALAYEQYFTDVVRASGQAVLADLLADFPLDMGDPRVQNAIKTMRIRFASDINQVTQNRMIESLRDTLSNADREGWGYWQIQEEIKTSISEVFDVRKKLYERERIARTEMHKASELGSFEGARQSGLVLKKGWLASFRNSRDSHIQAHGVYQETPIDLEESFVVGPSGCTAQTPGNTGCPEEDINCGCTVIYLPEEPE